MSAADVPLVGVVVVNWFGDERTLGCLRSLERLTWPAERLVVALVDNGSERGFLSQVRTGHPTVRVVASGANVGFGHACNLGFEALADCDHIALLNNDAIPEPGWLEPLVEVLEGDSTVGAATPKVLLDGSFVTVELRSPVTRPGGGDPRALGVQLCGTRVDGVDVSDGIELVSGFWGWEHDGKTVGGEFAWTDGYGTAHAPVRSGAATVSVDVRLGCGTGDVEAEVECGAVVTLASVGIHPTWVAVGATVRSRHVVNNVGIVLRPDGSTVDRGYLEPDDGQFDEPVEVFGWSGAAVLLSRRYIEDVGGFDGRFFLYYEDVDLSWRGRLQGWTYRYEPRSIVLHERSATVGARSALAQHLSDRNRLLMLTKCAPNTFVVAAVASALREFLGAFERDIVRRAITLRRPVTSHAARRARGLAAFVRLLPHAIRERRRIERRSGDRAEVLRFVEHAPQSHRVRIPRRGEP